MDLNVSELTREPRLVHRSPCLLRGVNSQSPMLLLKIVNATLIATIGLSCLRPLLDLFGTKYVYLLILINYVICGADVSRGVKFLLGCLINVNIICIWKWGWTEVRGDKFLFYILIAIWCVGGAFSGSIKGTPVNYCCSIPKCFVVVFWASDSLKIWDKFFDLVGQRSWGNFETSRHHFKLNLSRLIYWIESITDRKPIPIFILGFHWIQKVAVNWFASLWRQRKRKLTPRLLRSINIRWRWPWLTQVAKRLPLLLDVSGKVVLVLDLVIIVTIIFPRANSAPKRIQSWREVSVDFNWLQLFKLKVWLLV